MFVIAQTVNSPNIHQHGSDKLQSIHTMGKLLSTKKKTKQKTCYRGLPGGPVGKNPPANVGDRGSIPAPGRSPMPRDN